MAVSISMAENDIVMDDSVALVVDNDPLLRQYINTILHTDGFQSLEAASGAEAFRLVRALHTQLDLIVSDIEMPDGDGLWLTSLMAKEYPGVPCLLISGFEQPVVPLNAGFLRKPFLPSDFLRAVRRLLARHPAPAGASCGSAA